MDERIKKAINNLQNSNMVGFYVESRQELFSLLSTLLTEGEKIGCGDPSTPCVKLSRCINCKHEQRICNDFILIARQFSKNRIKVIFINGDYGY